MEALAIESTRFARPPQVSREWVSTVVTEAIRIVLGSIFLFSGLAKLRTPYEFLNSVYGYELAGPFTSLLFAAVLPWLEMAIAICLWTNVFRRGALLGACLLTALFSTVIGIALYRQLDISCGCFAASDRISSAAFCRSLILLVASIVGLRTSIRTHARTRQ